MIFTPPPLENCLDLLKILKMACTPLKTRPPLWKFSTTSLREKNDARRTRQHARKKYRKAENVQRCVCFVNEEVSTIHVKFFNLHENVVFSVSARTCIAAYVIFIMWNSISGLDTCCGVAVTVRSHKKNIR